MKLTHCAKSNHFAIEYTNSENDEEKSSSQTKGDEKQGCGTPDLDFDVKELKDQVPYYTLVHIESEAAILSSQSFHLYYSILKTDILNYV